MKRIIIIPVVIIVLLLQLTNVAASFSDLSENHRAYSYFKTLINAGVFTGDKDSNTIRPNVSLSRVEAVILILRVKNVLVDETYKNVFKDVGNLAWYAPYINTANKLKLIQGDKDNQGNLLYTFRPDTSINRAEFYQLMINSFDFNRAVKKDSGYHDVVEHWSKDAIDTLSSHNIFLASMGPQFHPEAAMTRADAAELLAKVVEKLEIELKVNDAHDDSKEDKVVETVTDKDSLVNDEDDTEDAEDKTDVPEGEADEPDVEIIDEEIEFPDDEDAVLDEQALEAFLEEKNVSLFKEDEWPEKVTRLVVDSDIAKVGNYKFVAVHEAFLIKKLTFTMPEGTNSNIIDEVYIRYPMEYNEEVIDVIKKRSINVEDGVQFTGLDMYAGKNESTRAELFVSFNRILKNTGAIVQFDFSLAQAGYFEAAGKDSKMTKRYITVNDPEGKEIVVRKNIFYIEDATSFNGLGVGDEVTVYQLKIRADDAGSISVARLTFEIGSDGVDLTANGLAKVNGSKLFVGRNSVPIAQATYTNNEIRFNFPEEEISPNSSKIFEVRLPVQFDGGGGNNTLSIRLKEDINLISDEAGDDNTGTLDELRANEGNNIIWSDQSRLPHSESSEDWANGYSLPNMPINYRTLK